MQNCKSVFRKSDFRFVFSYFQKANELIGIYFSFKILLPTPYSLLPTPYSLLPTPYTWSLLPTPYSLLPDLYSLLPSPWSLLPTALFIVKGYDVKCLRTV